MWVAGADLPGNGVDCPKSMPALSLAASLVPTVEKWLFNASAMDCSSVCETPLTSMHDGEGLVFREVIFLKCP